MEYLNMEAQIAVAKIKKYATSQSGDTVEIIERPSGGISVVLADGQSSGRGAKHISNMVTRKVISLLAEGVRDGAAARAASDYLFSERQGRVSATLNILSVDLLSKTLVLTRNNTAPSIVLSDKDGLVVYDTASQPIGLRRNTRPEIIEMPLLTPLTAAVYTDGLVHAGKRSGAAMQVIEIFRESVDNHGNSAEIIANGLLEYAIELDQGRPTDDISIVVLNIVPKIDTGKIRKMNVFLPFEI